MPTTAHKRLVSRRQPAREPIFGDLWEFDPAPETADPRLLKRYDLFIDGRFLPPRSGKYFATINPGNEQKLAEVALANDADVDAAYQAAGRAFETWSEMPGCERSKYIYRLARLLQDRAREFAVAETMDGGKPIEESRDLDVPMAAAHFFYHAGWADKLESLAPGRRVDAGMLAQPGLDHEKLPCKYAARYFPPGRQAWRSWRTESVLASAGQTRKPPSP